MYLHIYMHTYMHIYLDLHWQWIYMYLCIYFTVHSFRDNLFLLLFSATFIFSLYSPCHIFAYFWWHSNIHVSGSFEYEAWQTRFYFAHPTPISCLIHNIWVLNSWYYFLRNKIILYIHIYIYKYGFVRVNVTSALSLHLPFVQCVYKQ